MANINHSDKFVNPTQARKRYPVLNNPIKSRSPGVVGIGRNPRRSTEGATACQIVMPTRIRKMTIKKMAVGTVHSIQAKKDALIIISIIVHGPSASDLQKL
jgi:hypothetical protein